MIKNDETKAALAEALDDLMLTAELSHPRHAGRYEKSCKRQIAAILVMVDEMTATAHATGMHDGQELYLDSDEHMEEAIDRQNDFIARVRDEINEVLDHVC